MKKFIFLFLIFITTIFSCDNDSSTIEIPNNELKKRVTKYYGGYTGANQNFLTDSITEFYENKLLIKRESWYYIRQDESSNTTTLYKYDNNNLLIELKTYDNNKNIFRGITTYQYDSNLNMIKRLFVRKNFPSFNLDSINKLTTFEYKTDTIKKIVLDNILNTSIVTNYLTKNNLITKSNLNSQYPTSYFYDSDNNLIKSSNDDSDNLFSNENIYSYGDQKEPLVKNSYGTLRNYFLISGYNYELCTKYLKKIEYIHASRNGNYNDYIYTLDNNNRTTEIKTEGSFLAYTIINYEYY